MLLDTVRRRINGGSVDTMSPRQIAAARGPHAPPAPGPLGNLLRRLTEGITGRPHGGVTSTDITVPGAAGDLPARRHVPDRQAMGRPLVLHLHGGGWVVGAPEQYDWLCSHLAAELGAVVVSVDYRMAPEHPAPAAVQDSTAVARWILQEGGGVTLGADGPVVVAGDSAGGNLAALVAIAMRDAGIGGIAAQLLIYPATDLTMSTESARTIIRKPLLHRADMEAFTTTYLGGVVAPDDPSVSPLHVSDLSGLPPALVITASDDPLRDEGRAFAERLQQAGVPVRYTEYVDMPHGFVSLPGLVRSARQALAEMVQFASGVLDR